LFLESAKHVATTGTDLAGDEVVEVACSIVCGGAELRSFNALVHRNAPCALPRPSILVEDDVKRRC
jgi:hypothetical protein